LGYALKLAGTIDADERDSSTGIGKAAQARFNFRVNEGLGSFLQLIDNGPEQELILGCSGAYRLTKLDFALQRANSPIFDNFVC